MTRNFTPLFAFVLLTCSLWFAVACADNRASAGAGRGALSDRDFIRLCEYGTTEAVARALRAGANPNAENEDGSTADAPLVAAVHAANPEMTRMLLKAGADVNARGMSGFTALVSAVGRKGAEEVVAVLLDAGADPNVTLKDGVTALMWAVRFGNIEAVRALLRAGADVNASADAYFGWTALMWVWAERKENNEAAVVRELLRAGADVNARVSAKREYAYNGFTALMVAVLRARDFGTIEALLEAGADVDARGPGGETALMCAAHRGFPELVRTLVAAGADVGIRDRKGRDALWYAERAVRPVDKTVIQLLNRHHAPTTRRAP